MWRLVIWLWLTQRNGKGPPTYLGLLVIEWLALLVVLLSFGYQMVG